MVYPYVLVCIVVNILCLISCISIQEPVAKRRRQLGRRDSEEAVSRAMTKHFAHIPKEVVETARVDGLLVHDKIRQDRAALGPGARLGASYWIELAGKVGRGVQQLETLKPCNQELPQQSTLPLDMSNHEL